MPGPVVRTILHDIRQNWTHLQIAEALRSYGTARAMALARGLPQALADDVARRAIAAARSDFDVPAGAQRLPGWLHAMLAPAHGSEHFASRLLTRQARAFVDWLIEKSGPDGVLDRDSFDLAELEPWRRNLTILRREPEGGDFRYRLYGPEHCEIVGRDLTGCTLSVWPGKIARVKRGRAHTLVARRAPVLVHSVTMHYQNGSRRRGTGVLEQLLWPMRYRPGTPDTVIDLSVLVPESSLTAETLRRDGSRLARDYVADGGPVEYAPRIAC